MSFDYANTDPDRRRMRFGSRLIPLLIGLAIVVFGSIAVRKYVSLNGDEAPPQPAAKSIPTGTRP